MTANLQPDNSCGRSAWWSAGILLVHDHASLEQAHQQLPDVRRSFCRGTALVLGSIARLGTADRRDIGLLTGDQETCRRGLDALAAQGFGRIEWGVIGWRAWQWGSVLATGRVRRDHPPARPLARPLMDRGYDAMIPPKVAARVSLFSGTWRLVTDRRHPQMLAARMCVPHVVDDNSCSKIRPVFDGYTFRFPAALYVPDWATAGELLESIDWAIPSASQTSAEAYG